MIQLYVTGKKKRLVISSIDLFISPLPLITRCFTFFFFVPFARTYIYWKLRPYREVVAYLKSHNSNMPEFRERNSVLIGFKMGKPTRDVNHSRKVEIFCEFSFPNSFFLSSFSLYSPGRPTLL